MESITLPDSLKTIEENVFRQCESLKNVIFPNTVEKIDFFAFYKTGLEIVKFSESLREIAQGAFAECESLKTVKFGEGLEVLGTDEYFSKEDTLQQYYGVFEESAVECASYP